jgi:prepilin-type N-terminal cleavage/methylation domain-containing protein/prepilin-type processing-associated H-X9-DG protein
MGVLVMRRRGFTLVELLVVVTIIGILIALLLPAVQMARESARRVQCVNNLKQLTLAFQLHHEKYGYFPGGGIAYYYHMTYTNGSPAVGINQAGGWGFQILPFIEQTNLWMGTGAAPSSDPVMAGINMSIQAVQTPVRAFFCPTRRLPMALAPHSDWYTQPESSGQTFGHAPTDYAASSASESYTLNGKTISVPYGLGILRRMDANVNSRLPPITATDVTDGLSNTFCLGEKQLDVALLGTYQSDDNEGYTVGWDWDSVVQTEIAPTPDGSVMNGTFGSSHPAGLNMSMADGSVRFVTYNINFDVWRFSANRNDRQNITLPP